MVIMKKCKWLFENECLALHYLADQAVVLNECLRPEKKGDCRSEAIRMCIS